MGAINPSELLVSIKRRLGIKYFKLPIDDEELLDIITTESLRTFSTYFPNRFTIRMDNLEGWAVKGTEPNVYYIDDSLFKDVDILGIRNIKPANQQMHVENWDAYMYNDDIFEFMTSLEMYDKVRSMTNIPITFSFVSPDKMKINSSTVNSFIMDIYVDVLTTHPKNLSTIPLSYYEDFKKMCELDIKITLYEILKHLDKIDTTFGQIDLKIDDWSNANDNREQLIQTWQDKFINDREKKIFLA